MRLFSVRRPARQPRPIWSLRADNPRLAAPRPRATGCSPPRRSVGSLASRRWSRRVIVEYEQRGNPFTRGAAGRVLTAVAALVAWALIATPGVEAASWYGFSAPTDLT